MKVVSAGAVPSLPPMYRILVPIWAIVPSTLAAGSESSVGATSHGMTAPTGGGHGSVLFSGGQKLIGLHARMPRSIVLLTVK